MSGFFSGRGVAAKATVAGLALMMSFGPVAAPAFAATAGLKGDVTITQASNAGATYDAYRIVKADIDAEDKGARFEWESDAVKTAVLGFLDGATTSTGATQSYADWLTANSHTAAVDGVPAHDLPQNAIEYIAAQVAASPAAAGTSTTPETKQHGSFAENLGQAIKRSGVATVGTATTGTKYTDAQGYYLFVTTASTLGKEEAGTAPIFVALGATAKTVTEKSAIPTIDKQVKEDKALTWGRVADANKGQDLDFKLTGTLPTDYDAYDSYHLQFTDTLPSGMSLKDGDVSSVKVTLLATATATSGTDITSQLTGTKGAITYADDVLTVNIADLRQIASGDVTVTKDAVVLVEYKCHLDDDCIIGQRGNDNEVYLTYTNDPVTLGDGQTQPKRNKVATYQLGVEKVDHDTREALQGAKFTVVVADGGQSDAASVGKYVQADGSLSDTAYEFTTGADGKFSIPRIDEGVYTVHETKAPTGYEAIDNDVTVTITAGKDQTAGTVTSLAMTVAGGNGPDGMATPAAGQTAVADNEDGVLEANVSTGSLRFRVSDDKKIYIPGTGLTPNQAGTVAGIVMVIAGVGTIVIRQRRRESDLA